MMRSTITAVTVSLLLGAPLAAQTVEERLAKLEQAHRELLEAHSREIERLQFGGFSPALGDRRFGMGPAASKVYGQDQGLSIGGYGEFLYQQRSGAGDLFDVQRGILYVGYRFDEHWVFNSELEVEHASTSSSSGTTSSGGSVSLEFSYLEYLHDESFNLRAGLLLVPLGFINEMHEPTTFLSAVRPETELRIIPSTWRENGIAAHGKLGDFDYKAGLITSLNGERFSAAGLRDGRQKGNRAAADDFALVGRLDWQCCEGLTVGGALFVGDTGHDGVDASSNVIPSMRTTILEGHAEYQAAGFVLRGLYTRARVDDTGAFNSNTGANLARRMQGYYAELGYDVMAGFWPETGQALLPYCRWEALDTQAEMAPGFVADPTRDETILTFGIHYRPIDQVVIKVDFQSFDQADDRFQIGMGYVF
jgi:hypothetical protein